MEMSLAVLMNNNVEKITINYIKDDYDSFLSDKRANSESTFKAYRSDLNQFFMEVYGKEPQHVTVEDMSKTTGNEIFEYRNRLREKYSSNSTVNRKINAIRSFFNYMETDYENIRSAIFNKTKKLKENNKRGWGVLTYEEVMEMVKLSKNKDNGYELSMLVEIGFKTCIRLGALLDMTWGNIHQREQHGKKIWVIDVIDKEERHVKAIADNVYDRLLELKKTDSFDEEVFKNFHPHKVGDMIHKLCEKMDIDPRRNIRFHSLKKAGINFVYDSTGDIMMAQKQGNHKDPSTTIKSYMEHKEDLTAMPSYTMGETIDLSALKTLSKEEILEVIAKSSATVQLELLRRIKE
jgi:integrase